MQRTRFPESLKRTRRKKPESDLKTLYYYRYGRLKIDFVDNSSLGLYLGEYVFIKKYSKERDQFLVEDWDGDETWTDSVVPVRPMINGYELYYTSYPLVMEQNLREGMMTCFRTKNGFAFLKREIQTTFEEYQMFVDGTLNLNRIPKGFNFILGYSDNYTTCQQEN